MGVGRHAKRRPRLPASDREAGVITDGNFGGLRGLATRPFGAIATRQSGVPPAAVIDCPLTQRASSEARKATISAISSG